jgi:hypothetical protein
VHNYSLLILIFNYKEFFMIIISYLKYMACDDVRASFNSGSYQETKLEKAGQLLTWHTRNITKLIPKLYNLVKDPRFITVALTATAMFAVSAAFYPATTILLTTQAYNFAAKALSSLMIPWAIKLGSYISINTAILGFGMRTYGRFDNPEYLNGTLRLN